MYKLRNNIKTLLIMNVCSAILLSMLVKTTAGDLNITRWTIFIALQIAWNILLLICIGFQLSPVKHLVFIALFPVKLGLVCVAIYFTIIELNLSDTYSWIGFILLNYALNEMAEVYTLVKFQ